MKIKAIVALITNGLLISSALAANEIQASTVKVQEKNLCKNKTFGKLILLMVSLMGSTHR